MIDLTMCERFKYVVPLLLMAIAIQLTPDALFAQQTNRFVPESAVSGIVIKPKASFAAPSFDLVPHEIVEAFGKTELGVEILELNRALFFVDKFDNTDHPPEFGIVLEFDSDQKFGGNAAGEMEAVEFERKPMMKLDKGGEKIYVYQFDSKTILAGSGSMMKKMLVAENVTSPLTTMIEAMPETDHLNVLVSIEAVRDVINANLPPVDQMPVKMRRLRKLPAITKSIALRHSFEDGGISELRVAANNAGDAKKMQFLLANAIDVLKNRWLDETGFSEGGRGFGDVDYDQAMREYVDRMAGLGKGFIKSSRDGNDFVFDLNEVPQRTSGLMLLGASSGLILGNFWVGF